jgi:hypothetical protein
LWSEIYFKHKHKAGKEKQNGEFLIFMLLQTEKYFSLKCICCAYLGAKDLMKYKRKFVYPPIPCIVNNADFYSDMRHQVFVTNFFQTSVG